MSETMDSEKIQQLIVKLKKAKEEALARRENDKKARRSAKAKCLKVRLQSVQKTNECIHRKRKSSTVETEHDFQQDAEPQQKAAKVMPQTGLDKKQEVEGKTRKRVYQEQRSKSTVQVDLEPNPNGRQMQQGRESKKAAKIRDQKEKWRIYSKRYRDKLKNDTVLAQQTREKEHARYLKRKQLKQIKLVSDASEREKRQKRRKWRENTKRYRQRQALAKATERYANENSPPETPLTSTLPSGSENATTHVQHRVGRRKVRRDRAAAYARLKELETKLKAETRKAERYKKRLQRMSKSYSASPSPRKKVNMLLKGTTVSKDIRKRLEYSECLSKQLKCNAKAATGHRQKQIFTRAVSGSIIKKYRMLSKAKQYCPWWRFNSVHIKNKTDKLEAYIRKERMASVRCEQRKLVTSFLEDNANSRLCAGKKECVSKGGEKRQKRLLCDSLCSLHIKFCQLHGIDMSYSKFCRLRPFWIVEPRVKDRESCLCVRHENMELLVQKLHQLGTIKESNSKAVCKASVCDTGSKRCMYGECEECQLKTVSAVTQLGTANESFYYKWITKVEQRTKATDRTEIKVKVTAKEKVKATVHDMFSTMQTELPAFKQHQYRVYHQQAAQSKMKSELSDNDCLLIMDFSENYLCKYSAEVQSVHFGASKQQVTLHTAVLYYRKRNAAVDCVSFCTVSDSLRHDPSAVWAHLQPITNYVSENLPDVDTVHLWSDGPTTQYRNKRNFSIFSQIGTFGKFNTSSWNFTESGHGKGAADGVGGSIKRYADSLVAQGRDIRNADDLVLALEQNVSSLIFLITDADISDIDARFDTSRVRPLKGTMKLHQLTWTRGMSNCLGMRYLSCLECPTDQVCHHYDAGGFTEIDVVRPLEKDRRIDAGDLQCNDHAEEHETAPAVNTAGDNNDQCAVNPQTDQSTVNISDYVAVIYDNTWYPGVVESATAESVTVNFMSRSGKYFIWPSKRYVETLPTDELLCAVIGKPRAVSKTRFFLDDSRRIDGLCAEVLDE